MYLISLPFNLIFKEIRENTERKVNLKQKQYIGAVKSIEIFLTSKSKLQQNIFFRSYQKSNLLRGNNKI